VTYTAHEHHHQAKNMHTAENRFISVYTHCYQTLKSKLSISWTYQSKMVFIVYVLHDTTCTNPFIPGLIIEEHKVALFNITNNFICFCTLRMIYKHKYVYIVPLLCIMLCCFLFLLSM
jgi:hypothetical protein